VTAIDPTTMANVRAQVAYLAAETEQQAAELTERLRLNFGAGIVGVFSDSLAAGFEAAISTGSISDGFKALTKTLLSGLGGMLIEFGKYAVATAGLMAKLYAMIPTNPIAAVGVGLAMIALGATLRGAASRAFSGGTTPPPVSGYSAPAMGGNMTMPTSYYGPTSAGSANTIERINPISVTIIGPNDPTAQRQMQELLRNAQRRGNV